MLAVSRRTMGGRKGSPEPAQPEGDRSRARAAAMIYFLRATGGSAAALEFEPGSRPALGRHVADEIGCAVEVNENWPSR